MDSFQTCLYNSVFMARKCFSGEFLRRSTLTAEKQCSLHLCLFHYVNHSEICIQSRSDK